MTQASKCRVPSFPRLILYEIDTIVKDFVAKCDSFWFGESIFKGLSKKWVRVLNFSVKNKRRRHCGITYHPP